MNHLTFQEETMVAEDVNVEYDEDAENDLDENPSDFEEEEERPLNDDLCWYDEELEEDDKSK